MLSLERCFRSNEASGSPGQLVQGAGSNIIDLSLGEDVLRERERAYTVTPGSEHMIVVRDLRKEFPPQDGNPKKVAVENMSLAIAKGECFGCVCSSS
jgi:ABC-type glutathione transport system ATPase component